MAPKKNKLELTWIGKDNRPRLEPRILIEEPEFSHHAQVRCEGDIFDNMLIHGDNLLALKALETDPAVRGKVKCVYIDPPYNTGAAFQHYDDGLEHSIWLEMMRNRIEILSDLLSDDGYFFCQADDNEAHYLKLILDEIFGRRNFVTNFIWRKVDSPNDNKVAVTPDHEFIFCYAKDVAFGKLKQKPDSDLSSAYGQIDENDKRYRDRLLKKNGASSLRQDRPSMFYGIPGPDGEDVFPIHDDGREARWASGKETAFRLLSQGKIFWKKRFVYDSERWVPYTREWAPDIPTRPYPTMWADLHTMRQAKSHQKELFGAENVFSTPKPENLIQRIIEMSTDQGDLILDSFAGSGTTGAVAHKMGRRWIMVELGEHAKTHIVPRMQKVIDGADKGGVTEATSWNSGGGYRFFRLAPSLLQKDVWGNWVISKDYNAEMLAEAMCKHFNYVYAPSDKAYWMHGQASENAFIYVTTASLTFEQLRAISDEVGEERSLLVCCMAYEAQGESLDNLTLEKIPRMVLDRCEWGKDDYSLRIDALPMAEEVEELEEVPEPKKTTKKARKAAEPNLFGEGE